MHLGTQFFCRNPSQSLVGQAKPGGDPYLVCAPTPGGQHREPKNETWPWDVSAHRVPKHVEGIRPWEVTGGIGHCDIGDGLPVPLL